MTDILDAGAGIEKKAAMALAGFITECAKQDTSPDEIRYWLFGA